MRSFWAKSFKPNGKMDRLLAETHPNPERSGCPGLWLLFRAATRRLHEDPVSSHLTDCSLWLPRISWDSADCVDPRDVAIPNGQSSPWNLCPPHPQAPRLETHAGTPPRWLPPSRPFSLRTRAFILKTRAVRAPSDHGPMARNCLWYGYFHPIIGGSRLACALPYAYLRVVRGSADLQLH
jgi:hypothetical protein